MLYTAMLVFIFHNKTLQLARIKGLKLPGYNQCNAMITPKNDCAHNLWLHVGRGFWKRKDCERLEVEGNKSEQSDQMCGTLAEATATTRETRAGEATTQQQRPP